MDRFKYTAWNIEHSDKLLDHLDSTDATKKRHAAARLDAITEEIALIDADILFVSEGPRHETRARAFFDQVAPNYDLVTRPEDTAEAYGMKGGKGSAGRQWLWFLIRKDAPITGKLLHLDQWMDLTKANAKDAEYKDRSDRWQISFPELSIQDDDTASLEFKVSETHEHWRHPQVLLAEFHETDDYAPALVEFIGCHLKSKYNDVRATGDVSDKDFFKENPELVAELIKARVKISTEATDVRHYIEARFAQDTSCAIVVSGDINDGPGKERIERRFLYHDLIGNLQGDIFFSRQFLNHALFDAPDSERWSVYFEDKLDPGRSPYILLDHILFTQSMSGGGMGHPSAFKAVAQTGLVEHEVHHRVTSTRYKYANSSDHRPVSMTFERRKSDPNS